MYKIIVYNNIECLGAALGVDLLYLKYDWQYFPQYVYSSLHDKLLSIYTSRISSIYIYLISGLKSLYQNPLQQIVIGIQNVNPDSVCKKFRSLSGNLEKGPMLLSLFLRKFFPIGDIYRATSSSFPYVAPGLINQGKRPCQ